MTAFLHVPSAWAQTPQTPQIGGIDRAKIQRIQIPQPTGPGRLRPIKRLDEVLSTEAVQNLRFRQAGEVIRTREGKNLRPLRFHGPFIRGSELPDIQIWVRDASLIGWYTNYYFTNHPDNAIFQIYYPSATLPSRITPGLPQRVQTPGDRPATSTGQQFQDMLFQLTTVDYVSAHGGSQRLRFTAAEDNEFELRSGSTLWDLVDPTLDIYINLAPAAINRQPFAGGGARLLVELHSSAIEYDVSSAGVITRRPQVDQMALTQNLQFAADAITAAIRMDALRFAHGFFHAEFQQQLPAGDLVDEITLSNGFVDVKTHVAEPVIYLFTDGVAEGPTRGGEPTFEWDVAISSKHVYSNGVIVPGPKYSSHAEGTMQARISQRRIGAWTVAEVCDDPHVVSIEVKYRLTELDPIFNDRYEPATTLIAIPDCTALRQHVQATQVGATKSIDDFGEWIDLRNVNGNVDSELNIHHVLMLTYR
jgi:hypothetical protein